jgi:hypothetical protein
VIPGEWSGMFENRSCRPRILAIASFSFWKSGTLLWG